MGMSFKKPLDSSSASSEASRFFFSDFWARSVSLVLMCFSRA